MTILKLIRLAIIVCILIGMVLVSIGNYYGYRFKPDLFERYQTTGCIVMMISLFGFLICDSIANLPFSSIILFR